jgi:hypothetical protein
VLTEHFGTFSVLIELIVKSFIVQPLLWLATNTVHPVTSLKSAVSSHGSESTFC